MERTHKKEVIEIDGDKKTERRTRSWRRREWSEVKRKWNME